MLGLAEEQIWMLVLVAGAVFLAVVVLGIYGNQAYQFAVGVGREAWYTIVYYFWGPRTVEV